MGDLTPDAVVPLSARVRRIVAGNAGPMTGPGTNTYLVGANEVAVVDPGPDEPDHVEAIVAAVGTGHLRWILLTHFHGDHAPAAAALAQRTGAAVCAAAAEQVPVEVDRVLADGDELVAPEFVISVLATPGHARHHLGFLLADEAALFTGDTVLDGMSSVVTPDGGDMAEYLATLDRFAALPLARIYPGHGAVIDDPIDRVQAYAQHRRDREADVRAALSATPVRIPELTAQLYAHLPLALRPVAEWQVYAHLVKLRDEGLARGAEFGGPWTASEGQ